MVQDTNSRVLDTIIVGGGIAGLTVGYRLRDRDILLLEKEEVCGGRTISRKLGEFVYNAGAQVILGDKSLVAQLADELGVQRTLIAKTKVPLYIKGKLIASSSEAGFLWKLPLPWKEKVKLGYKVFSMRRQFGALAKAPLNPQHPKVIQLDSLTMEEFIDTSHPDARAIWDVLSIGANTFYSHEVSAYQPVNTFLHFMEDEFYVEGGTWQLAKALYTPIAEKTETQAIVQEIVETEGRVRVIYEKEGQRKTVYAQRCVVAVPGPLVLSMVQNLPAWKKEALSKIEYGAMTSAGFLLNGPTESFLGEGVWRVPVVGKSFITITNPAFTFPKEAKERTGQGLLRVYTGDQVSRRLMQMADEEALDILTEDLISTIPQVKGRIVTRSIKHWEYAISPWRPGHLTLLPAVQAPTGNIHYCGDYTTSSGLEAAVDSAYRVLKALEQAPMKP